MKHTLVAFLLLAHVVPSFAQEEEKIVYVHTNRGPRNNREYKTVDLYDVYKFDVAQMVTGQILFAYEHRIGQKSSFEFELGPNLSNVGLNFGHFGQYNNGESRMGVSTSIGFRYYPSDDVPALNKFYVGPKFEFKNYNYLYQAMNSNGSGTPVGEQFRGYENTYRFMFNMGKQYWLSSSFCLDIYAGLGIGNVSGKSMNVYYEYNSQTQQYENVTQTVYNSDASVMFECGVKVGIGN